jgi:hypothetical protein
LSEGIFPIPNRVWQFERPWPFSRVRWNARNEALGMKNSANAERIVLEKQLGETLVQGDEKPAWTWPSR